MASAYAFQWLPKRICYRCLSPNFECFSVLIANFLISLNTLSFKNAHFCISLPFFIPFKSLFTWTSTNPLLSEEQQFMGMHDSQKREVSPQPGPRRQGGCFCGADIAAAAGEQTKLCSFSAPAEWAGGGGRDSRRMSLGMEVAQSNEEKYNERRQCIFRFIKKCFQW